jgi:hypothetical protein
VSSLNHFPRLILLFLSGVVVVVGSDDILYSTYQKVLGIWLLEIVRISDYLQI